MSMKTPFLGPLLAVGRTAEVYARDEGQIVKLFYAWCPSHWVQDEIEVGRVIEATALPTPRLFDTLEIEGRQGIIYERVDGPTMLSLSNAKPWLLFRFARQLAELHTEIHEQSGNGLPALRSSLREIIQQVECLPSDLKNDVLKLLEKLPDQNALCHFDFHPDQVLIAGQGPVIIDWMTAHQGHPLADVARTCVMLKYGQMPYGSWAMRTLVNFWRGSFLRTYIARYLELHPGVSWKEIEDWMIPVAAGRLAEGILGEQQPLLRFIRSHLAAH